jgi:hypothetical protein
MQVQRPGGIAATGNRSKVQLARLVAEACGEIRESWRPALAARRV